MSPDRNIEGHIYPSFHPGWGGFAEEIFHYSSRYYFATQSFLRNLSGRRRFDMSAYRAQQLEGSQRDLMAGILATPPSAKSAEAVIILIEQVCAGCSKTDHEELEAYRSQPDQNRMSPHHAGKPDAPDDRKTVAPLDPLLNIAGRLGMPVAVHERHVEIDMHQLGEHLDSPNTTIRGNLQEAVIRLHDAGYVLKNHPHLTHSEANKND